MSDLYIQFSQIHALDSDRYHDDKVQNVITTGLFVRLRILIIIRRAHIACCIEPSLTISNHAMAWRIHHMYSVMWQVLLKIMDPHLNKFDEQEELS